MAEERAACALAKHFALARFALEGLVSAETGKRLFAKMGVSLLVELEGSWAIQWEVAVSRVDSR